MTQATITGSPDHSDQLMRRAALAAVLVGAFLAVIKAVAWWWTDSVAMLASFADSGLDVAASVLNAMAISLSLTPADREHRFGHGKAEAVAGLAQAALVGGSALFLTYESIGRIIDPVAPAYEGWGIAVMLVSIAATLGLTMYQRHVVRQTGSLAVAADRLHYVTDLASNLAVLLALGLSLWLGWVLADGIFGLLIAMLIGWSAWSIVRQSFDQLIDRELPDEERARIKAAVMATPGALGIHNLRTRMSGSAIFIQFHLVLDDALPLAEAHAITDEVENALLAEFPKADILIHQDPSGVVEHHAPLAPARGG